MSDHIIRISTAEDFDSVMDIGDLHAGLDYLWYRYSSFMEDHNSTSYVYVIGGKVVGFCSVFLLDSGHTLNVRGGRVRAGYRGQGLYRKMMARVREDFKDVSTLQEDAIMLDNVNFDVNSQRLLRTYTTVHTKRLQYFIIEESSRKTFVEDGHPLIVVISHTEMLKMFVPQNQDIFPNDRIIVDWIPLRLLESNMKYILGQDSLALASKRDDGTVTLLSVGTPIPLPIKMKYIIDLTGSDVTLLKYHLMRHVHYAQSFRKCDIIFQVCFPFDGKSSIEVDNAFTSLDVPKLKLEYTTMYLLSKVLDRL